MVTATERTLEQAPPTAASAESGQTIAHLNARISAYLADSVILLAFILLFFFIGGLQVLLASDWGEGDPPNSAIVALIAIFSGGTLLSWTAFNVALMRWRGQTTGQYVLGIKTVSEDGTPLSVGRILLRWVALHPLLFHPFLLIPSMSLALLTLDFLLSPLGLITAVALALLTIASLVVNLLAMSLDGKRRALHDRLAGTVVVHFDQG